MRGWNYRIVRHALEEGFWYDVAEIYYRDDGGIEAVSQELIFGAASAQDLKEELSLITRAVEKDILDAELLPSTGPPVGVGYHWRE